MKRRLLLLCMVACWVCASAQHQVRFQINTLPGKPQVDTIYLAGSFNKWNPADRSFALTRSGNSFGITIVLPSGMHAYKFTTGSWEGVETTADGNSIDNRLLKVESDTTVVVDIKGWANQFAKKPPHSTASKNVQILDTDFYIPQLNRHRRVWLYLPPGYQTSKQRYPVLYLHDGQNVFDQATSFSGEWGVDEVLDSMGRQHGEMIVVAIDNGGEKRINEYSPFDHPEYGKGEGDAYVDFIVQTLVPYINKHYRTLARPQCNFIAGSSMGGLISMYAVLKYPDKFGAAGIFSPAFWISPQLKQLAQKRSRQLRSRVYFFAGAQESETMVPNMEAYYKLLKSSSRADVRMEVNPEGKHNEATWREAFPSFYKWLMGAD